MKAHTDNSTTTAMELPVLYVSPGQRLAEVFAEVDSWDQLCDVLQALAPHQVQTRVAYAYQPSGTDRLTAKLVLDVSALRAGDESLRIALSKVPGLHLSSIQAPSEPGLLMSERQRPQLAGTPAVIFGQPVIACLARAIVEDQGDAGKRLLCRAGLDAGRLAASALPPLIEQLGMTVSDDLLTRRMRDLQVMGWATLERASIEDSSRGEVTLLDTFEAAAWHGDAPSPSCHFLAGFIAGVFSFVWERQVGCDETECQATGAPACRFAFQPS
ncbi:MAG: V4R domain-containing protein [Acidimicrobiales bacterium]